MWRTKRRQADVAAAMLPIAPVRRGRSFGVAGSIYITASNGRSGGHSASELYRRREFTRLGHLHRWAVSIDNYNRFAISAIGSGPLGWT